MTILLGIRLVRPVLILLIICTHMHALMHGLASILVWSGWGYFLHFLLFVLKTKSRKSKLMVLPSYEGQQYQKCLYVKLTELIEIWRNLIWNYVKDNLT